MQSIATTLYQATLELKSSLSVPCIYKLISLENMDKYGALDGLARQRVNTSLIANNWDDLLHLAGSLELGAVTASEVMRTLLGGKNPTTLSKAIAELGRIAKTLYLERVYR